MAESICWSCKRALPGNGCSWADKFKPVHGWTAEPTVKRCKNAKPMESYHVYSCPKYINDGTALYVKEKKSYVF